MKRFLNALLVLGVSASLANAVQVRYFLSQTGLSNPSDVDSAAVIPTFPITDPDILHSGNLNYRFYLWAQIGNSEPTDLKGFDLAFRTTGDVTIVGGEIWQNNFVPAVTTRWNTAGVPGFFGPDGTGQFADPSPAVAVLEAGVTNGAFAAFDDQWVGDPLYAAVVGFLDVNVDSGGGEVHIINQGSGFLQIGQNEVYLGWDDVVGNPAEVPGQPYDNADWEARFFIPEPTTLGLFAVAAMLVTRRR